MVPQLDDATDHLAPNNTTMSAKRGPSPRSLTWTPANELSLVRKMHEYAVKHGGHSIGNGLWEKWAGEFQAELGYPVTITQLTSKRDRMKHHYECYHALLTDPSLCWDPQTRKIHCSSVKWDIFLKKFRCANTVRKEGIQHYDMLHDIFGKGDANGGRAVGSRSASSVLWQQQQNSHIPAGDCSEEVEEEDSDEQPMAHYIGASSRGVHKRQKRENEEALKPEVSLLASIADIFKNHMKPPSLGSRENSDVVDQCIDVLNGMSLPDEIYIPALDFLTDELIKAKVFIRLPHSRRLSWLLQILRRNGIDIASPSPVNIIV